MKLLILSLMVMLTSMLTSIECVHAQRRASGSPPTKPDPLMEVSETKRDEETRALVAEISENPLAAQTRPSEFAPAMIPVPRTGQVARLRAGDDGSHSMGLAWPIPRFTDNRDGTVNDNLTGLVWHRNPSAFPATNWSKALAACNQLASGQAGLRDGSKSGDWRLPNVREMESLIDYSQNDPALPIEHPFQEVTPATYWTSTTMLDAPRSIYRDAIVNASRAVDLTVGRVTDREKTQDARLWPVRCPKAVAGEQAATQSAPLSPVPRTGQIRSWEIGDDGYHQKGRPWPEPRFMDNRDGTVTDRLTGLVWLKDHRGLGLGSWQDALTRCNELADGHAGLSDGSKPGDWRLPNLREFQSLIDYSQRDPALPTGHRFTKPSTASHWTSTPVPRKPFASYRMGIRGGTVGYSSHVGHDVIWPVRGGGGAAHEIRHDHPPGR